MNNTLPLKEEEDIENICLDLKELPIFKIWRSSTRKRQHSEGKTKKSGKEKGGDIVSL